MSSLQLQEPVLFAYTCKFLTQQAIILLSGENIHKRNRKPKWDVTRTRGEYSKEHRRGGGGKIGVQNTPLDVLR